MNEWYELTNGLETDTPPLDEVAMARIQRCARAALPRRRKRRWLAAIIAAVLVLSACGYAAATGQFSQWFWNMAEDPQAPESSEDLLASMGTVVGQSQTVGGVTVTLNGALWDGSTMMLSLSLEGDELPESYSASVTAENSWLRSSKEQTRAYLRTSLPYMTDDELDEYLEEYLQNFQYLFRPRSITYLYHRQTETFSLQVESDMPFSGDEQELELHLEDLGIQGKAIQGPFDFTFTVALRPVKLVYCGETDAEFVEGSPVRVTKIALSPFQAEVSFTGVEKLELDANGTPVQQDAALSIDALRVNGQEVTGIAGQSGTSRSYGPDGSWNGSVRLGPFRQVIDPSTVEAVQVNGVWLELDRFTLSED